MYATTRAQTVAQRDPNRDAHVSCPSQGRSGGSAMGYPKWISSKQQEDDEDVGLSSGAWTDGECSYRRVDSVFLCDEDA